MVEPRRNLLGAASVVQRLASMTTDELSRTCNHTRYQPGQRQGHYESFFLRANHPTQRLAFWIRYTLFSPHKHPERAIGELWAVMFDAERDRHVAAKSELPFAQCAFSTTSFEARVGNAHLQPAQAIGSAASGGHQIAWDLRFDGTDAPIFLLPAGLYDAALPKAKALVSLPMARFNGRLEVDGESVEIGDWIGSQNHNWGSKHTDLYAWGQVAGFDSHPQSFLEVATARVKLGPIWTPPMTPLVLRHDGEEHALTAFSQSRKADGAFSYFTWTFASEDEHVHIRGRVEAPRSHFVGLRYYNPPGGEKHCLNSKLASCEVELTDKRSGRSDRLYTASRAAFEILTDDRGHGVEVRA